MIWSDTFSKYLFLCLWHSSKGYYSVPCSFRHFPPASPSSLLAMTSTHWGQERSNCVASCITGLDLEHEIFLSSSKKHFCSFPSSAKKVTSPPTTHSQSCTYIRELYTSLCLPPTSFSRYMASHVQISKSIILYSKWMFPGVAGWPGHLEFGEKVLTWEGIQAPNHTNSCL